MMGAVADAFDDAEREFEYTAGAEDALARGYTTISVKDDWATVFA